MTQYERIQRYRRYEKLRIAEQKSWVLGDLVRVRPFSCWGLTDYSGETFGPGEIGVVTRVTRSTIDVRDPRGHVHKSRPKWHFVRSKKEQQ